MTVSGRTGDVQGSPEREAVSRIDLTRVVGCVFITGIGLLYAAVEIVHVTRMTSLVGVVLEAMLPFALALPLVATGGLLWRADWDTADVLRMDAWIVVGTVAMSIVFVWTVGHQLIRGEPFPHAEFILVNIMTAGGVTGLVIGYYDVRNRALRTALDAEREHVEEQRTKLGFLNRELRHHVLNGVAVILAQGEKLESHVDSEGREILGTISNRAERLATVIERVRTVTRLFSGTVDAGTRPVDIVPIVREHVRRARENHPESTFETDVPGSAHVAADDMVDLVFENLVANAMERGQGEERRVHIDVEVGEDTVTVRVGDDGVPTDHEEGDSFHWEAPPGQDPDTVIGHAIVNALVERYGGQVSFESDDGWSTVVVVEFERSAPPT